ncbi:MAG: PA14 domain-containing protein [bacterium]
MRRFATCLAMLGLLAALALGELSRRIAVADRADGGPHHGLNLEIRDLDAPDRPILFQGPDEVPDLARAQALGLLDGKRRFVARWTGWLRIERAGTLQITSRSDDGSRVVLDGGRLVRNDGPHEARARTGQQTVLPGWHAIEIEYDQSGGDAALEIRWDPPGAPPGRLGPEHLVARPPGALDIWILDHVTEPLGAHRDALAAGRAVAWAVTLAAAWIALASTRARSVARQGLAAMGHATLGTPARRRLAALALAFTCALIAWNESDAARGGFASAYRTAPEVGSGPWLDLPLDPDASRDARPIAATLGLAARLEQRWQGWFYVDEPGSHWFEASGDAPNLVAIDGRLVVSHPGTATQGAPSRGRVILDRGVHAITLLAGLDAYQTRPAGFRWATPDAPFRPFRAIDVFPTRPSAVELTSQLRGRDARPAVQRLAVAALAMTLTASLGAARARGAAARS